jgi:hypothetical protein
VNCTGSFASYLFNLSINDVLYKTDQAIANNTEYGFSYVFATNGGWNMTLACANGSISGTNTTYFTMNATPIAPVYTNFFGYDAGNTTADYAGIVASYGYNLIGEKVSIGNFTDEWADFKADIGDLYSNYSVASFLVFDSQQESYTNTTSECGNVSAAFDDLLLSPYAESVQFIVLDFNNTATGGNTSGFVTNVSQCIMSATNNRIPVYAKYDPGELDTDYVSAWSMIYIADDSDLALTVEKEKGYMRNSTSLIRIYSGTNESFLNWSRDYHNQIIAELPGMPTGSGPAEELNIALLSTGDFVAFNNDTAANLSLNYSTIVNGSDMWDYTHKTFTADVSNESNVTVEVDDYDASLVFVSNY